MKSLRLNILKFMEEKVNSRRTITKKNPVIFSIKDICSRYPEVYPPSISREFRNMRKEGLLPCIMIGKREHGKYKLHISERYSKPTFVKEVRSRLDVLVSQMRKDNNAIIKSMLEEALEKRNGGSLPKVPQTQESVGT